MSSSASARSPIVSICVPTYNGKEHLSECIESIIAQTVGDFEVVVCDDQSSDGTLDFARKLAKGDERFRFIPNPRRFGLVGNWNNCAKHARGDWIKFVFQDDIIMPSCLEQLLAVCNSEGKLFGFSSRDFIFENGTTEKLQASLAEHRRRLQSDYEAGPVISAEKAARLAVRDLSHNPSHNPAGEPTVTLINTNLFHKLHGFDEALVHLADTDLWRRIMVHHGAVFIPESLAKFRIHPKATTVWNEANREFRMRVLDPLVLLYKFAFEQHFKSARNRLITGTNILSLRYECAVRAASAWSQARNSVESGDTSLLKEWLNVRSNYPALGTIAWWGIGPAFCRRLKQAGRRRLPFG